MLYREGLRLEEALAELRKQESAQPELAILTKFLADSARSIVR